MVLNWNWDGVSGRSESSDKRTVGALNGKLSGYVSVYLNLPPLYGLFGL